MVSCIVGMEACLSANERAGIGRPADKPRAHRSASPRSVPMFVDARDGTGR